MYELIYAQHKCTQTHGSTKMWIEAKKHSTKTLTFSSCLLSINFSSHHLTGNIYFLASFPCFLLFFSFFLVSTCDKDYFDFAIFTILCLTVHGYDLNCEHKNVCLKSYVLNKALVRSDSSKKHIFCHALVVKRAKEMRIGVEC